MQNIKDHISYIRDNEPHQLAATLEALKHSREMGVPYFHHFNDEELLAAKNRTVQLVNEHEQLEEDVKKEREILATRIKDSKAGVKKWATAARVGGIEKMGTMYILVEGARAYVYDEAGNLHAERPATMDERQPPLPFATKKGFDFTE